LSLYWSGSLLFWLLFAFFLVGAGLWRSLVAELLLRLFGFALLFDLLGLFFAFFGFVAVTR